MRLGSLAILAVGAAAGFAAAQRLLSDAPLPSGLPDDVSSRLEGARGRLQRYRASAKEGIVEARAARDEAVEELMRDYHARTDRLDANADDEQGA